VSIVVDVERQIFYAVRQQSYLSAPFGKATEVAQVAVFAHIGNGEMCQIFPCHCAQNRQYLGYFQVHLLTAGTHQNNLAWPGIGRLSAASSARWAWAARLRAPSRTLPVRHGRALRAWLEQSGHPDLWASHASWAARSAALVWVVWVVW